MMRKACALYDAGAKGAGEASNMAKFAAAEAAIHCVDQAIQTHGGNGVALEYGLSRHVLGRAHDAHRAGVARDDPQLRGRALARAAAQLLNERALNRALLARQGLLEREAWPIADALERLVGLQGQTPDSSYVGCGRAWPASIPTSSARWWRRAHRAARAHARHGASGDAARRAAPAPGVAPRLKRLLMGSDFGARP